MDGTLYHTETSSIPALEEIFLSYSLATPNRETLLPLIGETFDVFLEWAREQGIPIEWDAISERITETELRYVKERGKLYPGVKETLQRLREDGHRLALCTNALKVYAETVLTTCRISEFFEAISYHQANKNTKTERVVSLAKSISCTRAYMIGDRYHDLIAGRKAGCTVIGATYGYARPGELAKADHFISSFGELLTLL